MLEVRESLTSAAAQGTDGNYSIPEFNKGDQTQTRTGVSSTVGRCGDGGEGLVTEGLVTEGLVAEGCGAEAGWCVKRCGFLSFRVLCFPAIRYSGQFLHTSFRPTLGSPGRPVWLPT
ncbi:hypothetical protein E2C01_041295 [Portunus trituberculatus]|uniref:Uncharacterized protein n=1 Tax=Portunus trituberculatus TaxID=210409 RepID=A0A5B7FQC1_PORTR|nr:hypothetical protein [Portunus trituberculatus]